MAEWRDRFFRSRTGRPSSPRDVLYSLETYRMGDSEGPGDDAQEEMALLGVVDLAPSSFWALYPHHLPIYKAKMEVAPFRNLMDGSDCESDIATEGDSPGDCVFAAESTDEEEEVGDDFGYHMASPNPITSPFGWKSTVLVVIRAIWHKI